MGCEHVKSLKQVEPRTTGCEECLRIGQRWVSLRLCQSCGHVGCCDSSPGRHATAHFHQTRHPVMRAFGEGDWGWCYVDERTLAADELPPPPSASPQEGVYSPSS